VMEMPSLAIIPQARRAGVEQMAAMSTPQRNIHVLTQPKSQFTRSVPGAADLASAGHGGTASEVHPVYQRDALGGQDDDATNLACILAQSGVPVLLLDADLRRSNIHHRFGLTGKLGLTTRSGGHVDAGGSRAACSEAPNMDILPAVRCLLSQPRC